MAQAIRIWLYYTIQIYKNNQKFKNGKLSNQIGKG